MLAVKFIRTVGALQEEYGRVCFDGSRFYYDGLTYFFIKDLERGVRGDDHECYRPEHGILFLQNLKNKFVDGTLIVTDIQNI